MVKLRKYAWKRGGAKIGGAEAKSRPDQRSRAAGGGIHIKPSHVGRLHSDLGVPQGAPISEAKLERAKESAGPAERKRITFAENARRWRH